MAILSLNEIERKSGTRADQSGVHREHVIISRAITDGVATDGELLQLDPLMPVLGSFYQSPERVINRGMRLVEITPENDPEMPTWWVITFRYSTLWESTLKLDPNPLLRPIEISRTSEKIQEAVTVDLFGDTLSNSSDEPYDPPQTRDTNTRVITVTMNVAHFDEVEFDRDYIDCTNVAPWRGYPAFTVKIDSANSQTLTEGRYTFDRVSLTLRVKFGKRVYSMFAGAALGNLKEVWKIVIPDFALFPESGEPDGTVWSGWDRLVLDQGFRRLPTMVRGEATFPIMLAGAPISKPILLDGRGIPLTETTTGFVTTPRYHLYHLYSSCKFEDIGLGA
jgi:hypothetical protein